MFSIFYHLKMNFSISNVARQIFLELCQFGVLYLKGRTSNNAM